MIESALSDSDDEEPATSDPPIPLEEEAVQGWYGLATEIEAMNTHLLGWLQPVALSLAAATITAAVPFYAWTGLLLELRLARVCISMLLHWAVTILIVVAFWPVLKANYSTRLKVRIFAFVGNVLLAAASWVVLFLVVPWTPSAATAPHVAVLVVHIGGLGLELVVCAWTLCRSLRSGPGRFTVHAAELRREHVQSLIKNAFLHPRVVRDDDAGAIECWDGSTHGSVHALLAHCAEQGVDRAQLLDMPPHRWTSTGGAEKSGRLVVEVVKKRSRPPGLGAAVLDYFFPWRVVRRLQPRDEERLPAAFFYPTKVLFVLVALLASTVVLCTLLLELIPTAVDALRREAAKLEACGGAGACSYFVDVEEAADHGFYLVAAGVLGTNRSEAGLQAAIALRQDRLDSIIDGAENTSDGMFGTDGGDLYPHGDAALSSELAGVASSLPFLTRLVWDRAAAFRVHRAISAMSDAEYASALNPPPPDVSSPDASSPSEPPPDASPPNESSPNESSPDEPSPDEPSPGAPSPNESSPDEPSPGASSPGAPPPNASSPNASWHGGVPAVGAHRAALRESLHAALTERKICLDPVLTARSGERTAGGCQRICGRTLTSENPPEHAYLGSCLMWEELADATELSMLVGVIGASAVALLSIVQTAYGYKARVLRLRRGDARPALAAAPSSLHSAAYFFGCALSCMLLGMCLVASALAACVLVFKWRPTREWFWEPNVRDVWVPWGATGVFFVVVTAPMYMLQIDWRFGTVKRPRRYSLLSASMALAHVTSASLFALWRLFCIALFSLVGFMRADVSLFPDRVRGLDIPFMSCLATIALHEPAANPLAATFVELLLQRPPEKENLPPVHRRMRNRLRLALLLSANPSLQRARVRRKEYCEARLVVATPATPATTPAAAEEAQEHEHDPYLDVDFDEISMPLYSGGTGL